nr:MAG TPA: hypothetical protein [Caudoviricetes sp.]
MSIETLSVLIVGALALVLAAVIVYLDIITECANEIREIAQSYGWADMDKVRKLDGKHYEPAPAAMDAQYFTMPDGTTVRRR